MNRNNKTVFTITVAVAMVAAVVGVTGYGQHANTMFEEQLMDSLTFELFPSASAIADDAPVRVGAYLQYTCWYGFGKCTTTPIYQDVSAGEQFDTQATVPNVWGAGSDLEMHHTFQNQNDENVTFIGKHWGTLADYSQQATRHCNNDVTHSEQYWVRAGNYIQDVRFCVIGDVEQGDLASWTFQLI